MKYSIHLPRWVVMSAAAGALTMLSACADDKMEVAAEAPADTAVGSVQTFDIGTADAAQVGNALSRMVV